MMNPRAIGTIPTDRAMTAFMRQLTVEGVLESILELRYTGLDGEFNSAWRDAQEPAHREPLLAHHGGVSVRPRPARQDS